MNETNPALAVLGQIDTGNMAGSAHLFAEDVVWHYSNLNLPEL